MATLLAVVLRSSPLIRLSMATCSRCILLWLGSWALFFTNALTPVIVVACFELGYGNRLGLAKWFPLTKQRLVDFAERDYIGGIVEVPPHLVGFSPMRFWTTHPLSRDSPAVLAAMFPVFFTFVIIILYAPLRKFYRSLKPPRRHSYRVQSGAPMKSGKSGGSMMHLNKSFFTVFELATGAELQNRVGLVSDYDSCVYIKGLRYASADGIYSNGFVIANGRWLIKTSNILTIIVMIVVKVRCLRIRSQRAHGQPNSKAGVSPDDDVERSAQTQHDAFSVTDVPLVLSLVHDNDWLIDG